MNECLQGGKGDGELDEDEAVIASIQFGGPKVRRLADADDSSDGDGSAAGADDSAKDNALQNGKGANGISGGSKGKGRSSPQVACRKQRGRTSFSLFENPARPLPAPGMLAKMRRGQRTMTSGETQQRWTLRDHCWYLR